MSFGEELALYCILSGIASGIISIIIGRNKVKEAIKLKNSKEISTGNDINDSLSKMIFAINQRLFIIGISSNPKDIAAMPIRLNIDNKSELNRFIKMAHAAGLEIVLRPRKEGRPGGGEEEEGGYVSASRQSDYAC